jgi:hypothetical protein
MDWIRVIVFDILILWHVGLYFVQWDTLVDWDLPMKNNVQVGWLSWPMLFIRQWRLPILFVISGIGTRFALSSRSAFQYIRERSFRLLLPLLTGILLLVPPLVYLERNIQGAVNASFWSFYPEFFKGLYPEGNFSWHHLWFLAYLFLMSMMALPLFLRFRRSGNGLIAFFNRLIGLSPFSLYLITIPLMIVHLTLENRYPLSMNLQDDWFAFTYYLLCFIWGFILSSIGEGSWKAMMNIRRYSLCLGAVLSIIVLTSIHKGENPAWIQMLKPVNTWSWIIAVFGYASLYLNRESATLKYRNTVVYPFYVIHFTILIFLGYVLMNFRMHYAWKMVLMVIGTYGISFILIEYVISRINFIRPLFGLKRKS